MANFLLIYHGGSTPTDPAEVDQAMAEWTAWFGRLGGAVVDGGNPVAAVRTVAADGSVTDGAPDRATGYSILAAPDLDAAVALAAGCPLLAHGGRVEVAETIPM